MYRRTIDRVLNMVISFVVLAIFYGTICLIVVYHPAVIILVIIFAFPAYAAALEIWDELVILWRRINEQNKM